MGGEPAWRLDVGQHADHRADRVPDEDHLADAELVDDLVQVVGMAVQRVVLGGVVRGEIRHPASDQIEGHDPVAVGEGRRQQAPHALVAAEAMGEDHGRRPLARHADVVALLYVHSWLG